MRNRRRRTGRRKRMRLSRIGRRDGWTQTMGPEPIDSLASNPAGHSTENRRTIPTIIEILKFSLLHCTNSTYVCEKIYISLNDNSRLGCLRNAPPKQNVTICICMYVWMDGWMDDATLFSHFRSFSGFGGSKSLDFGAVLQCKCLLSLSGERRSFAWLGTRRLLHALVDGRLTGGRCPMIPSMGRWDGFSRGNWNAPGFWINFFFSRVLLSLSPWLHYSFPTIVFVNAKKNKNRNHRNELKQDSNHVETLLHQYCNYFCRSQTNAFDVNLLLSLNAALFFQVKILRMNCRFCFSILQYDGPNNRNEIQRQIKQLYDDSLGR